MSHTSMPSLKVLAARSLGTLVLGALIFNAAPAAADGIKLLTQVSTVKADQANQDALDAAGQKGATSQQPAPTTTGSPTRTQQANSSVIKKHSDTQNALIQNMK